MTERGALDDIGVGERLLEVCIVARRLSCSQRTVWRRIQDGTIVAVREGHRWLVREEDLVAYVASLPRSTDRLAAR